MVGDIPNVTIVPPALPLRIFRPKIESTAASPDCIGKPASSDGLGIRSGHFLFSPGFWFDCRVSPWLLQVYHPASDCQVSRCDCQVSRCEEC